MAAGKRAAEADPVDSHSRKKNRVDTPLSSHSQMDIPEDASSVADTSATASSKAHWRPKIYVCRYSGCGKAFDRPIKLQTHTNTHTGERPYACAEEGCDKRFYKSEHLRTHMKNIHAPSEHVCTYVIKLDGRELECSKTFTTKTRLQRHIATHEAKEERKCDHCGQTFRKLETLQRHVQKEHLEAEEPYRCTVIIPHSGEQLREDVEGAFNDGEQCGQTFPDAHKLQRHKEREHTGRKYFCPVCSSGSSGIAPNLRIISAFENIPDNGSSYLQAMESTYFTNYNELKAHVREEHPPTCMSCGKVCASNNALKAHIDIHHGDLSERKVHPCTWPGCDRSFTKKGNLNVHVQAAHVKLQKYVCGEFDLSKSARVSGWDGAGCGLALGTKASLEGHVQTQHLGFTRPMRVNQMKKKVKTEDQDVDSNDDIQDLMPFLDLNESTPTESISSTATPDDGNMLGLLTGAGYADGRPIACLMENEGCQHRFLRQYDLSRHMVKVHHWGPEDNGDVPNMGFTHDVMDQGFPTYPSLEHGSYVEDMFTDHLQGVESGLKLSKDVYHGAPPLAGLDDMFGDEAMVLDPALRGV